VDRVIFLRRYWYGDRVKDIARRVGMTENAVSVRLNRLRSSLRTILSKEGYYEP
jgi:RNA polymerase sigma-70 factor (ECF subfamily)